MRRVLTSLEKIGALASKSSRPAPRHLAIIESAGNTARRLQIHR
jgi:hypothetical protein